MEINHPIYEKVKFVEGENFITIEETEHLSGNEISELIETISQDSNIFRVSHVSLLVTDPPSTKVGNSLSKHLFKLHDELVFYRHNLRVIDQAESGYELKSLNDVPVSIFLQVWENSMKGSLNAPSYLDMNEQLKSVEKELGHSYRDTCKVAYEGDKALGVIMPHIEPGTDIEGRFFYFGLVPEARGLNKSIGLYLQGLKALRDEFHAVYSVGSTSIHNKPMRKVFEKTGCRETGRLLLFKKTLGD